MSLLPISGGIAHVGLPKTGSTFLQKHYFAKLPLQFFSTQPPFTWPDALGFVFEGNSLWYEDLARGMTALGHEARGQRYVAKTEAKLSGWRRAAGIFKAARQSPWLASGEGLCGLSAKVCALHMSLLRQAGVTKIIFVFRRQADYAQSLWRQFLLAEDRFARYVSFETLFGAGPVEGVVDLDWNQYLCTMDAEFGADNVLALPYELMVADPAVFFGRLNAFLGLTEEPVIPDLSIRENPSRCDVSYQGLSIDGFFPFKRLPRLRRRLHRFATQHPQMVPDIMRELHSMVVDTEALGALQRRYASANRLLEARVGMDLIGHGYY